MLGLFTWWELRIPNPLIDLRVFAVRAFSAAAASVTVIFFALFGSLFVLTQYLQLVHGYSPLSAGVRALPFAIAMAAVSPVSTVLAGRLGSRVVIPAGIALMGAGLLDLSTAGVHTSYPPLAVAVAIMGAGMGLVMAPASTTIMTTVPAHQAGAGSAVNDTIREVGGALGHRDRRQPGRECVPLEARQRTGHHAPAAAGEPPGHQLGRRGGRRGPAPGRRIRRAADRRRAHRVHHGHGHRHAGVRGGGPGRRGRRRVRAAGPQAAGSRDPPPAGP